MEQGSRINGNITAQGVIEALCDSNIGACNCLIKTFTVNKEVDPSSEFGDLGALFTLNYLNIYGENIWILYKYVCKENIAIFIGVLKAAELGLVNKEAVIKSSKDCHISPSYDSIEVYKRVKKHIKDFDPNNLANL